MKNAPKRVMREVPFTKLNAKMHEGKVLGVTGHRPGRTGGYNDITYSKLSHLATNVLSSFQPTHVITGMALGWDLAIAEAALERGIPYTAMVPFIGQPSKWTPNCNTVYYRLLNQATNVEIVSKDYGPKVMQRRNIRIIESSEVICALYNGTPFGGTAHCVKSALAANVPVINCWNLWV